MTVFMAFSPLVISGPAEAQTAAVDDGSQKCPMIRQPVGRNPEILQICAHQQAQVGHYDTAIAFIDEARSLYVSAGNMAAVILMDEIRAALHYTRFNTKRGG
ncbi:MAG: hypothetical protein ACON5L_04975 [Parvibaculales bacterium]